MRINFDPTDQNNEARLED